MKVVETSPRVTEVNPVVPLSEQELKAIAVQMKAAFPAATEKMLETAISECRKECEDPDDRQRLIRCVVERITA